MAVVSWAASDRGATTTPKTLATSWSTGDVVIVKVVSADATTVCGTPTVTGLTFNAVAGATNANGGFTGQCGIWTWRADAASNGSGNISVGRTGTINPFSFDQWVVSGRTGSTGNTFQNQNETSTSMAVSAGSDVLFSWGDWLASTTRRTPLTMSGTVTERADANSGGDYGYYALDAVDVSAGTFSWGVTSYTGLQLAQAGIELPAAASPPQSKLTRRHIPQLAYR